MMTTLKILGVLFLAVLSTYNQTGRQLQQTILYNTTSNYKHVEKISDTKTQLTISKIGIKCKIDTLEILANKNLMPLIKKLQNTILTSYKSVDEIPYYIMNFLKCTSGGEFSMANPGKNWQATDVYLKKKLPARQLIYFGLGDGIALLTFYTGGIGVSEHILIFRLQDKKIVNFWCGDVLADLKNKKEIIKYLIANKDKKWGLNTNGIYY